jgi:soluble lytic murein transglycosylase
MKGVYFIGINEKLGRKLAKVVASRTHIFISAVFLLSLEAGLIYQNVSNEISLSWQPVLNTVLYRQNNRKKNIKIDPVIQIIKAIGMFQPNLEKKHTIRYANIVRKESIKYGYDWRLIVAIMKAESNFDKRAVSNKGAIGLMQVMPETAEWLSPKLKVVYFGVDSLYDPEYNIKLGIHYLNMMHKRFGDIDKALIAYNRGPNKLMREINQGEEYDSEFLEKVKVYYQNLKDNGYKYPA